MTDDELAASLAAAAGRILLAVRGSAVLSGKALGATGDAVSHAWLTRALATARPDDGVLSEEGTADVARLEHERLWIVDPLDGTREFSEAREDWAVHVALVVAGVPTSAAVALPAREQILATCAPIMLPPAPEALRIAVSRSRPPAIAQLVADALGAKLVSMGSAGWKAMAVAQGYVHAYLHAGGQYEWDSAAPAGVAVHAGLHVSALDGSPLRFGKPDPWSPDLLICRPELAPRLLLELTNCAVA